ncbi:MAG: peptidoglycan bridge formation glycyltransferase FemA/FemB family protein [Patescibacteria group bacterium]|nr:peptidoglycan bridge formation glycyltransferase FemA/FemB family protein [Patescibacteria group bacterium]
MQIINIDNKEQLNNFVGAQKHSQFLQAWQWGEFHKVVSRKVFRLGVEDNGKLVAAATVIKKILPMGKFYFYCPRGPVGQKTENHRLGGAGRKQKTEIIELLFNKIKDLTKEEAVMFFRFDPAFELPETDLQIKQTLDVQPSKTLILNLKKIEQDLLSAMHQKTRYNIKLAEKKGVKIVEAQNFASDFDKFWQLMGETSDRDSFRTHGINYYKEMLKLGGDFIKLFFAEYKNKTIGAVIISFFGDTATYMHGASANEHREAMAPHLLQWHCIKLAKDQGYKYYDFYGIDEKKWPGVTRFKKGFCVYADKLHSPDGTMEPSVGQAGKTVNYPGTFDLIFNKNWYNVYKMVRKVRRTF